MANNKLPYKVKKQIRSKYYNISFYVGHHYSKNGMHQESLKEVNERKAFKKAIEIYRSFNFDNYKKSPDIVTFDKIANDMLKKRLRKYREKYPDRPIKTLTPYKEQLRYVKEMKPHLGDLPFSESSVIENELSNLIDRLKTHGTVEGNKITDSTINKYVNLFNLIQNEAINQRLLNSRLQTPYVKRRNQSRPPYRMLEIKQITDRLREESKDDIFNSENADFIELLTAIPTRPGLEPLNIKIKDCNIIPNIKFKEDVLKIVVFDTKTKPTHVYTASPHFTRLHYPRIVGRNIERKSTPDDYLFFPTELNRPRLMDRIRRTFTRISKELDLYYFNGLERPMYSIRHMHAKMMQNKGVSYDLIASNMNTSVEVLMSTYLRSDDDYNVVEMHNAIYHKKVSS